MKNIVANIHFDRWQFDMLMRNDTWIEFVKFTCIEEIISDEGIDKELDCGF